MFCELKRNVPNAQLILVGVGEELDDIKQIAREIGLEDSVCFLGGIEAILLNYIRQWTYF